MRMRTIVAIAAGVVAATWAAIEIAAGASGLAIVVICVAAGLGVLAVTRFVWGGIAGKLGCAAAIALMAVPAGPARAHPSVCRDADGARTTMSEVHGERRVAMGALSGGRAAEMWVNEETRTWTLLAITPTGIACVLGVGEAWEATPPPAAPPREG